ncbi:putative glutamine amidotransferase [Posidoniimonas polymericola]|uniref:Putative glutamine amidotransferase n=1 Tax=Posidoniimonas polymericola TaxID=2528002 RepID=A0A5C5YSU2_9BACT|nr:gamma-glutamyl-gamma-aminobutyrate hydrolase family protein [Posidoniimonas polymericola]TWT77871.1 putative glutamine amidotransferase [Posidoniimonas polymericola]
MKKKSLTTLWLALALCFGATAGFPSAAAQPATVAAPPVAAPPVAEPMVVEASAVENAGVERTFAEPVIGIASLTTDTYVRAIRACGGVPLVLPNTDGSPELVDEYLELLDGLLMPGGADIPPSEWGEAPHPTTRVLDDNRYQFEKALIKAWIEQTDKPLLGICLGSQWVNVAHGGSLMQDIPSELGVSHRSVTHKVTIEPDSRLMQIFGRTELEVNSFHHQAVRNVGQGLRVVARSPDGVIEGTETTDPNRFLIGVQWHPEKMMPGSELQAKLFRAFIAAAAEEPQ